MILADKILRLRKRNGWSQDDLAERLNVSRQSVSKWESAQSIPDIGKLIDMARLFGVTTDYLLKDELQEAQYTDADETEGAVRLTLEEANAFLEAKPAAGRRVALGVVLCILSPVPLILLAGYADGGAMPINTAVIIGMSVLLCAAAAGVACMLASGMGMRRYEYLKKSAFNAEYGVLGMVAQRREEYEGSYTRNLILGVSLCILSVLPLVLAGLMGLGDIVYLWLTAAMLACVAVAVWLFIATCTKKESYDILLKDGEYTPAAARRNRKGEWIGGIYWPIVAAAYLGWSLITGDWHITWIIWLIAGILYGAVCAIVSMTKKG